MFLAPNIIIQPKEGSVPKSEQNWLNTLVYITASFNQGLSLAARGGGERRGPESSLPFFPGVTAPENWGYVAVAAARPGPQPFRRRSAARGEAGSGGPGPDPGSGPAEGEEREGEGGRRSPGAKPLGRRSRTKFNLYFL